MGSVVGSSYINQVNNITGSYIAAAMNATNYNDSGPVKAYLKKENVIRYLHRCGWIREQFRCIIAPELCKRETSSLYLFFGMRCFNIFRNVYVFHFMLLPLLLLQKNI
jgi:hypothetical protein